MSRYNFASLSGHDFEELTRDLLQAEWKVHLEAFKAGRDAGIDLRYASAFQGTTIVQCKHFLGSGYSKLLRHLRQVELPKISKLAPARYVLVTTVGLTPQNKDELREALQHYSSAGVRDEISACDDVDQMIDLRETLGQLVTRYGLNLGSTLSYLDDEIAERIEPEPDYDSESGRGGSFRSSPGDQSTTTEEDVREMFGSLREDE
jgi:hypothetical protein